MSELIENEPRKRVNIVNEANRIALAGSCTCGDSEDVPISDFAKALIIRNAAVLLDELLKSQDAIDKLQSISIIYEEAEATVNTLHIIAEQLAGSRVLELYGPEEVK